VRGGGGVASVVGDEVVGGVGEIVAGVTGNCTSNIIFCLVNETRFDTTRPRIAAATTAIINW
jgi:hypothetical protein